MKKNSIYLYIIGSIIICFYLIKYFYTNLLSDYIVLILFPYGWLLGASLIYLAYLMNKKKEEDDFRPTEPIDDYDGLRGNPKGHDLYDDFD